MKKQILGLMTAVTLLFSTTVSACAVSTDLHFTDVDDNAWYSDAVAYVQKEGLMSGTSAATFSPDGIVTRGMLTAILYRHAGSPPVSGSIPFKDVPESSWYHDAANWSAASGVISGYSDDCFGGNDPVTRQQLATILWRSAGSPGVTGTTLFYDQAMIAPYAVDAIVWASENGIIHGTGGNEFAPDASATRAQLATMLHRWLTSPSVTPERQEDTLTEEETTMKMKLQVGDHTFTAVLHKNSTVDALKELLADGPLTLHMADYAGMEKGADLGTVLPQNNVPMHTQAGDIILYQGKTLVIYYDTNSWSLTPIGKIEHVDPAELRQALGTGDVTVTVSLE